MQFIWWILIQISLKFVHKSPNDNESTLLQVMVWHQEGDKPLPEPMMLWFTDVTVLTNTSPTGDTIAWTRWSPGVSVTKPFSSICYFHSFSEPSTSLLSILTMHKKNTQRKWISYHENIVYMLQYHIHIWSVTTVNSLRPSDAYMRQ